MYVYLLVYLSFFFSLNGAGQGTVLLNIPLLEMRCWAALPHRAPAAPLISGGEIRRCRHPAHQDPAGAGPFGVAQGSLSQMRGGDDIGTSRPRKKWTTLCRRPGGWRRSAPTAGIRSGWMPGRLSPCVEGIIGSIYQDCSQCNILR
jgi:hypothetical protein